MHTGMPLQFAPAPMGHACYAVVHAIMPCSRACYHAMQSCMPEYGKDLHSIPPSFVKHPASTEWFTQPQPPCALCLVRSHATYFPADLPCPV